MTSNKDSSVKNLHLAFLRFWASDLQAEIMFPAAMALMVFYIQSFALEFGTPIANM
jgi:hypothetical protein